MTRITWGCVFLSILLLVIALAIREEYPRAAQWTAWAGAGMAAIGVIAWGIEWQQTQHKPQHRKRNK